MGQRSWYEVNVFRPRKGLMGGEVFTIVVVLFCWGGATFGFQFLQQVLATDAAGENVFTRFNAFNLPLNVFFTAQCLPLWFIFLCLAFNLRMDRLTERHSRKRYPHEHE